MNRNSIRWRLPASYALIALLAALSLGSIMILVLRNYYAIQEQDYLFGNANALQPVLENALQSDVKGETLQEQVQSLSFLSQSQIRILNTAGEILADSGVPDSNQVVAVLGASGLQNTYFESAGVPLGKGPIVIYSKNAKLPEVLPFNKEIPYSGPAPQQDMMLSVSASPYGYGFVARTEFDPARRSQQSVSVLLHAKDGNKLGLLEFSNGPSYGADVISSVTEAWIIASVFAMGIAALAGWFISRRVTRPVLVLEQATQQMEQGNLSVRVELPNEKQQEFVSLANSFNGMAAQVEQTVSTLRAFVADAAHELHTPLTALLANLELARDEKDASEQARYLGRVREQGQRLEALVDNLLALSRIEATEAHIAFTPVDLTQLVKDVGEPFASRAEQMNRIFTPDIPDQAVEIMANANQLKQVLQNLLENALKFTPVGGTISLHMEQSAEKIRLTVADTGIGIPPEDVPDLFKRFHRARNASAYPGNGLGLAIVKAIVTLHQGSINVRSGETQGTTITITFPVSSIQANEKLL